MDKILVTGSEGFFASRFIDFYNEKFEITSLKHGEMDIADEEQTSHIIGLYKPDYVVHAAAISDTGACGKDPDLSHKVNFVGSVNVAKACKASGSKLIFLSSDQVYAGNPEAGPYIEDEPVFPNNTYGKHKLAAENSIFGILPDAVALRLTWLFCLPEKGRKTNSNIIWNCVRQAMKNQAFTVCTNDFRGITYVYELIENFEKFLSLPGGVYNAGSENDLNAYDIMSYVLESIGIGYRVKDILIKDEQTNSEKPRDLRINTDKIKGFGICFNDTVDAIRRCISDFKFTM